MQGLLKALCQRHAVSALFVTHDIEEALLLDQSPFVLTPGGARILSMEAGEGIRDKIIRLLGESQEEGL